MAGMLPGVECARRRRFHHNSGWLDSSSTSTHGSTRRLSFCLYTSNHGSHLSPSSSMERNLVRHASLDETLDEAAREAKERLDGRLRSQWKSETKRGSNRRERFRNFDDRKSGSKRFSWTKLSWISSEHDKCGMCLDQVKAGATLLHLPCAHMIQSRCLMPYLDNPSNCPCCRMKFSFE